MATSLLVLVPESKAVFAHAFDADLLWIALRHVATICETAGMSEVSICAGPGMLTAVFHPLEHKLQTEQLGVFVRQVGQA